MLKLSALAVLRAAVFATALITILCVSSAHAQVPKWPPAAGAWSLNFSGTNAICGAYSGVVEFVIPDAGLDYTAYSDMPAVAGWTSANCGAARFADTAGEDWSVNLAILYGPALKSGTGLGGTGLLTVTCGPVGTAGCLPFTRNPSLTAFILVVHFQLSADGRSMALVLSTDEYDFMEPYGYQTTVLGTGLVCGPIPYTTPPSAPFAVCGGAGGDDEIN